MSRYFKYILLVTFLTVALVIVFLQFNSNQSISQLINGNEDLLGELNLKTKLQQLQTGIIALESKVRGTVIEGVPIDSNHLKEEIETIQHSLQQIDTLQSYHMIAPLVVQLNQLVNAKINFNRTVLDTFSVKGKKSAELLINNQYGKQLADSINFIAARVEGLHQLAVTDLIQQADSNGRKAKTLGSIMAFMAAVVAVFTFGYVSYKVRQQQDLIVRLNTTEKKLREAATVKENFMANMSHEIRTPMNAILGFTNLLQRKELDSEAKEYVETIKKSGDNLLTIINDILDLSKIEAGMMRIEPAVFSMRKLIHSVEAMFRAKAEEKQLQLTSSVDESLPDILKGDAFRLTQILVNLVGNALKFTGKGRVILSVSDEGRNGNIQQTGITVSDTGIGIESGKLNHIFERFQQAEDTVTRKYGGTGLGLSIVKELVMLQNGNIQVESEPGKGTAFKIILPYTVAAAAVADLPISKKEGGVASAEFKQERILVAEDNEINQQLISHLLRNWKLEFDITGNGREAIHLLQQKPYALILMDIQMPEMDGYTATEQIRNSLKLDIPIIAMTAHAMTGEREKCLSYGMNEYISKPIQENKLLQFISAFIHTTIPVSETAGQVNDEAYRVINLGYMREVSGGNKEYEKTVTEQFIETIPFDLNRLEQAWEKKDLVLLRQTAHNMRTTVSVMGLNELLQPRFDALEYHSLTEDEFTREFSTLRSVCSQSLTEAEQFLSTL